MRYAIWQFWFAAVKWVRGLRLRRLVDEGAYYPTGYRCAWFDWDRRVRVCYPVGLHLIAWAIRWAWLKTYWRPPVEEVEWLRHEIAVRRGSEQRSADREAELRAENLSLLRWRHDIENASMALVRENARLRWRPGPGQGVAVGDPSATAGHKGSTYWFRGGFHHDRTGRARPNRQGYPRGAG